MAVRLKISMNPSKDKMILISNFMEKNNRWVQKDSIEWNERSLISAHNMAVTVESLSKIGMMVHLEITAKQKDILPNNGDFRVIH